MTVTPMRVVPFVLCLGLLVACGESKTNTAGADDITFETSATDIIFEATGSAWIVNYQGDFEILALHDDGRLTIAETWDEGCRSATPVGDATLQIVCRLLERQQVCAAMNEKLWDDVQRLRAEKP